MSAINVSPFEQAMEFKCKQISFGMNSNITSKNNRRKPKAKFSAEEDTLLQQIVAQHGAENWDLVSKMMPGRTPRMCHDRWENYVNPAINHSAWTEEEDHILMQKYNEFGPRWVTLAKFFNGRTDVAVKNRWHILNRRLLSLGTYILPPRPNHMPKSANPKHGEIPGPEKQALKVESVFGDFVDFIDEFSFDEDSIFNSI